MRPAFVLVACALACADAMATKGAHTNALQASHEDALQHAVNSTVETTHADTAARDPTDKEVVLATVKRLCFHCIRGCLHGRAACEQCVRGCVPLSIAT